MSPFRAVFLGMLALLLLTLLPGGATAISYLQLEDRGLFGTVTEVSGDHPRAVAGETDITLDTRLGPVEFTATVATQVRIPGFESASVEDLSVGDPLAVFLSGGTAVSILVKTEQLVGTRHFTGVVTSVMDDGFIGLGNRHGEQITAPGLEDLQAIQIGELVTAVIEQDLTSGGLVVTGLDRASASLERIKAALELAQRSENNPSIGILQQRLIANSTIHLTTLKEVSQRDVPAVAIRTRQELNAVGQAYASALSQYGAGKPMAEATGIVTSIDSLRQRLIIEPHGLDEVEVAITDRTSLWRAPAGLPDTIAENWLSGQSDTRSYAERFGGREIQFAQLDVANRVRGWYDLETASATRILVLPGESLPSRPIDALLSLALQGEANGDVVGVNLNSLPQSLTIQDEVSGITINLLVSSESKIGSIDLPLELSSLPNTSVTASYDPESYSIIELNQLSPADSGAAVHGVVHSFISKVRPGNFLILNVDGQIQVFNHTENTVINRDGRRVSISEVRLGDLVRPTTRYRTWDSADSSAPGREKDLVLLSLKSPAAAPVEGTIRGISDAPGEDTLLTISDNWLELISLLVSEDTQLMKQGQPMEIRDLAVGLQVVTGSYDALSSRALRLVLTAARSVPIKGEITAIDESRSSITVTPLRGAPIGLVIGDGAEAGIILRGTPSPGFNDLQVGQQVRIGFYDPGSLEALRLVVN